MKEKLQQIVKDQVPLLPKEVQEAMNSLDWMSLVEEIGKKHLLSEEEIDNLQTETLLVLIGMEEGEAYVKNIEDEVGTSAEEAEKIADEADEKIFAPIYNSYIENIKKSGKAKNGKPEQNLNFILSGGDYSAFVNPPLNKGRTEEGSLISDPLPTSPLSRGRGINASTPQEGNNIPTKPQITDIKSKFTI
jgi:hypothetical protein